MKLPLKARIFQYAVQQQNEFTMKQVMQDLAKEYASESIFSEKQVEEYFDSFLGVGFFKATRTEFDAETGVFDNRPEGFVDCHTLGEQRLRAGRCGQFEQAVVLAPAGAAGDHVEQGIHGLVCRERGWPGRRSAQFPETDVERVTGCRLAAHSTFRDRWRRAGNPRRIFGPK